MSRLGWQIHIRHTNYGAGFVFTAVFTLHQAVPLGVIVAYLLPISITSELVLLAKGWRGLRRRKGSVRDAVDFAVNLAKALSALPPLLPHAKPVANLLPAPVTAQLSLPTVDMRGRVSTGRSRSQSVNR